MISDPNLIVPIVFKRNSDDMDRCPLMDDYMNDE
jgi:hypothetical protein